MLLKAGNRTIEQLELFRPTPSRPLWSDLPEHVKAEACELVAQMLRAHAKGDYADEAGEGESKEKVKPTHLNRKAILYVRQSSTHQVFHNLESQRLQYAIKSN